MRGTIVLIRSEMPRLPSCRLPHEDARHGVIPDCAHNRPGNSCNPPLLVLLVDPGCDTHVREEADTADRIEAKKAADESGSAQALIAVGQTVIDDKIAGHGDERRECLGGSERHGKSFETRAQCAKVHDDAKRPDKLKIGTLNVGSGN